MRLFVLLLAATPLALAASCQGDPDSQSDAALAQEDMQIESPAGMAGEGDPIETVALADAELAGEYRMTAEDGTSERLTLDPEDKSYTYTGADGVERTGNYTYADDYRLMIEDYDGSPAWFSFDNSTLYRLTSADAEPNDPITVSARYTRDNTSAAQTGGPNATTATVADKRD